jgi:branched-chain amino acid aminotransferase
MNFIIVNNEIIRKDEANLTGFLLDQPFIISQKIWFGYGGIPLFMENIDSLCQQLDVLKITTPNFLKNKRELFRISKRMLNKNRYYKSGILNIQLYIFNSEINYTITCWSFESSEFPFSGNGALVDISNIQKDAANPLNQYIFYNKTIWRVIEYQLQNSNYQNSILLNEKNMVCEGIATNIFMVKDDVLITPSLECGCFEDTLRIAVLEVANRLKMKVMELPKIKKEYVLEMNELFFASEHKGIEWILGIGNKRFIYYYSQIIHQELNEYLKKKVI